MTNEEVYPVGHVRFDRLRVQQARERRAQSRRAQSREQQQQQRGVPDQPNVAERIAAIKAKARPEADRSQR